MFDADIRDFFTKINREWLVKFIEHRITDKRVVRLIQKWLNAGILEEGKIIFTEEGTAQGSSASPMLANVFLHYVYDLWIQQWRKQKELMTWNKMIKLIDRWLPLPRICHEYPNKVLQKR